MIKRESKRSNRSSSKPRRTDPGPIQFSQSIVIEQQGHFVKPSSHASFTSDRLSIICKGYGRDGTQMAHLCLSLLKESIQNLVEQTPVIVDATQKLTVEGLKTQEIQRYFILNLIDSCFEELSDRNLEASCSFGITYVLNDVLYVVKNQMLECYLLSSLSARGNNIEPLFVPIGSKSIPFQLNTVPTGEREPASKLSASMTATGKNIATKQTKGFMSCDKQYQNAIKARFFPEVQFFSLPINEKPNSVVLFGNSECFCHFDQKQILSLFGGQKSLSESGNRMMEIAKKKWKTIYQEDMTLIVSILS